MARPQEGRQGQALTGVLIGTSGWSYTHWKRRFYPKGLPADEELEYFTTQFPTVELNNSFYRLPDRAAFGAWRRRAPDDFVFAVKGSRFLTHLKRLREPEEPVARLLRSARGLGPKLGPLLFQLPPNFALDMDRLDHFLAVLRRRRGVRFTVEFRHESWLVPEVFSALERNRVALCIPVGMKLPYEVRLTTDWSYIRMHKGSRGIGFGDREIATWAQHVRGLRRDGAKDVYVYFNNDTGGHALEDARRLRAALA